MNNNAPRLTDNAHAVHDAVRSIVLSRAAYLAGDHGRLTTWTDASRRYRMLTGRNHPSGR